MDKNMISIVIATKNGGQFLPRAISSIEKQTDKNIEVIIVSDGSTDDTVNIAKKLASTRPFIRVLELENNIGPGLARNAGIKEAHGSHIALLDDDDEWLDAGKLAGQKKFLDDHIDHVLVGSNETEFVNEQSEALFIFKPQKTDSNIRSRLLIKNQFITSSVMFRKETFEKVGCFAAMYLAEDYDLWLRLAQAGKMANISGCKTRYYRRSAGAQQKNQRKINTIVLALVKKYKNSFPHPWLAMITAYTRLIRN